MHHPRRFRFYGSFALVWMLGVGLVWNGNRGGADFEVMVWQPGQCVFKAATGIPCPGCGTTRSIIALSDGNWLDALWWNPVGYVVGVLMLVLPFWICADLVIRRATLMSRYHKVEAHLKKPMVYIPIIVFVAVNWIWNIIKGL